MTSAKFGGKLIQVALANWAYGKGSRDQELAMKFTQVLLVIVGAVASCEGKPRRYMLSCLEIAFSFVPQLRLRRNRSLAFWVLRSCSMPSEKQKKLPSCVFGNAHDLFFLACNFCTRMPTLCCLTCRACVTHFLVWAALCAQA